jgi:hypothetical protein
MAKIALGKDAWNSIDEQNKKSLVKYLKINYKKSYIE